MFTRTQRSLMTAAALAALLPTASWAEETDYSYWNKGTTQHAQDDDAAYRQPQGYRPAYPPQNYSAYQYAPGNDTAPRAVPTRTNNNSSNWTYDYD